MTQVLRTLADNRCLLSFLPISTGGNTHAFFHLLPFLLFGCLELLAVPSQPFGNFIHKLLRFIVNLAVVLGHRLCQFLEGDETVRLAMRTLLVLIGE